MSPMLISSTPSKFKGQNAKHQVTKPKNRVLGTRSGNSPKFHPSCMNDEHDEQFPTSNPTLRNK